VGFDKFENLWEICGEIKLESPLHIGTQYSEHTSGSALPVLLQYDASSDVYLPFIPGSSLKGVLRSTAERILNTHKMDLELVRRLFGSQEAASKVKIRDSPCIDCQIVEERVHTAAKVKKHSNYYVRTDSRSRLYYLETIPITSRFEFRIHVENASEGEIALLLRALDELRYKRAAIGGGVSRGHGFVSVNDVKITKSTCEGLSFNEEEFEYSSLREMLSLPETLPKTGRDDDFKDFNTYAAATNDEFEGCVVCEALANCETDFRLPGADEPTVTGNGYPVIPGSTIKGFLRHLCYKKNRGSRRSGDKWLPWTAEKVDEVFGSQKQRSKILISEAFPEENEFSEEIETYNHIPAGSKLRCWIVFDNLRKDDISKLKNILMEVNQITGNQSARKGSSKRPELNKVSFEFVKAWKYHVTNPCFELKPNQI